MVKTTLERLFLLFFFVNFSVVAQVNPWSAIKIKTQQKTLSSTVNYATYDLNAEVLNSLFYASESSFKKSQNALQLPLGNASFQTFVLSKNSVLHPKLAAKYPLIKAFVGRATDGSGATARISYAPSFGLRAVIMQGGIETQHIVKAKQGKTKYYAYKSSEAKPSDHFFECEVTAQALQKKYGLKSVNTRLESNNGFLRKYRLAVATSGEYSQYFLDGTEADAAARKEKVLTAIVATISRVNGIFERDFGVTMELVATNDQVIFLDETTDPFQSNSFYNEEFNGQLQTTLDNSDYIGSEAYDVGHFFHRNVNRTSGNAGCIACICTDGSKGSAYSQHPEPDTDDFNLLVAHEFGHQYGGFHVSSVCHSGINSEVEPGSGSTIMSYAGICSPNVQEYPDDYFNYVDIRDVAEWTANGSDCAELIPTSTNAPTANAGLDYVVPKSTPFVLEGITSEPNTNMEWTYCWEQNNPAPSPVGISPQPTWQTGPMFRSRLPSGSPVRYMPQLEDILVGNNTPTWEVLPSVSRDLNFVLTVRDNVDGGGQTASDTMNINVADTAGPFIVTSQTTSETWNVGEEVTVAWDVANTNVAPVNAQTVDVYVSTDGGYTYPNLVQSGIPNNGSATFALPFVSTTTEARLMVRGHNSIFFAVNDSNFNVQASDFVMSTTENNKELCQATEITFDINYQTFLDFGEEVAFSVVNLPDGITTEIIPTSLMGTHTDGSPVTVTFSGTETLQGDFNFELKGVSTSFEKQIDLKFRVYENSITTPILLTPLNNADSIASSIIFNWEEDNNVDEFIIEIAEENTFENIVDTAGVPQNRYSSQNLNNNTQYFWRIIATNACEDVETVSETYSFITECVALSDLETVAMEQSSITLDWNDNGSTSWEIEYGIAGFDPGTAGTVQEVLAHPYTLENLTSNTNYDIYVRSICSIGGHSESSFINITTLANYCETGRFFDSGGENGDYKNNENSIITISPETSNERVRVSFQLFDLEDGYDYLRIYDGPNQNAPELFLGSGSVLPGTFVSSHETGALTFVFTSDSIVPASGWDATVVCEAKPNCPQIGAIIVGQGNANTVSLSWEDELSSSWQLEYGAIGFAVGQGTKVIATTNTDFEIENLLPSTGYDIYIKAICDVGGYSDLVGPTTIITPCATFQAPFYENFAIRSTPDCWTQDGTQSWDFDDYVYLGSKYVNDHTPEGGTNFAKMNGVSSLNDTQTYILQTPLINLSEITKPSIQFSLYSANVSNDSFHTMEVEFYDGATWNTILTHKDGTDDWREYVLDISSYVITGPIQVRWQVVADGDPALNGNTILLDEIKIEEMPICPVPYGLISSDIYSDSIVLSWTSQGSESNWEVLYGQENFNPLDGTSSLATTNPYTLENLLANTTYEVYIKAACGIGVSSKLIGPVKITTDCEAFMAPYEQRFDTYSTPDCWREEGQKSWDYETSYYNGQEYIRDHTLDAYTNFSEIRSTNTSGTSTLYSGTVFLEELTTPSVQFALYNNTSQDGIYNPLVVELFDGVNWNELMTLTEATESWRDYYFDLSAYTITGAVQVRFSFIEINSNYSRNDVLIDDVKFKELSSCRNPYNIEVSQITGAGAQLAWQSNGTETSWELQYGTEGFTLGNGTELLVANNPYELIGLAELTDYDVYIRAVCGAEGTSDYVGPVRFSTVCGVKTAPYEQDFSNYSTPECWEESNGYWGYRRFQDLNNPLLNNTYVPDHTPNNYEQYAWLDPYQGAITASLTSQPVTVSSLDNPSIQFALYSNEVEEGDYSTAVVELFDGTSWNQLLQLEEGTQGWRDYYYELADYTITGAVQVRFTITNKEASGAFQNVILIDDFKILETPSCFNPYGVSISNINPDSVTLSWESNGEESQWELQLGSPGFNPDYSGTSLQANAYPYEVPNLTEDTSYEVYLRAQCAVDTSDYIGPFYFETICSQVAAPYAENFTSRNMPECWDEGNNYYWDFTSNIYDPQLGIYIEDHTSGGDTNYAIGNTYSYGNNEERVLTTRSVDVSSLNVPAVQFAVYSTGNNNNLYNTLEVELFDGTAWSTIHTSEDKTNGWQEYYYDISGYSITSGVQLRFVITDKRTENSQYILIDDVSFGELPTCFVSNDVQVSDITTSSALINWSTTGSETAWDVVYVNEGSSVDLGTVQTVNTTSLLLDNLFVYTSYDVYVRANCGGGDLSVWSAPFTFKTLADYCGGTRFTDSGGDFENYSDNESITTVIAPSEEGYRVSVTFNSFELESCCDRLMAYDGPDISANLIGIYDSSSPGTIVSTHETGTLTFVFTSDGSVTESGWDATVTCESLTPCELFASPFEEVFEENYIPRCWTDYSSPWYIGDFGSLSDPNLVDQSDGGNTSIAFVHGYELSTIDQPAVLESPEISVSEIDKAIIELKFYCSIDEGNFAEEANIFDVEYYDGTNWNLLFTNTTQSENGWETLRLPIEVGTLNSIKVRFVVTANWNGNAIITYYALDDIKVYEDFTLSNPNFQNGSTVFTMFPNPVKNKVTIQSKTNIQNITLVNMLGQTVMTINKLSVQQTVLDMTLLQSGAYFVHVETEKGIQTKRLLKE